ncbi:MAG: sarcosine oxidase subunit gamma family protein [Alphaproteobacteria bacterium]|nr:sarcosine oxidase subunit gamma family protein [Alphaproteobacteria bacterium]
MVERYQRQSPLSHLHLAARAAAPASGDAGVRMREIGHFGLLTLRGRPEDKPFLAAAGKALGLVLPLKVGQITVRASVTVICQAPDQWLLLTEEGREAALEETLRDVLTGVHHSIVDVTHGWAQLELSGADVRDLLAKGCALDLDPSVWPVGRAATSLIAKAGVTLWLLQDGEGVGPTFRLLCRRSHAEYLWTWLEDAALEFGVAITPDES